MNDLHAFADQLVRDLPPEGEVVLPDWKPVWFALNMFICFGPFCRRRKYETREVLKGYAQQSGLASFFPVFVCYQSGGR